MKGLCAWFGRLLRRRRPAPPQHPALRGSQWRGVWMNAPHRPLTPADERGRWAAIDAGSRPRPWLAPSERERW
jgi:hypothetical protein